MYGKGGTENQTDSSSYTTAPNAEQNIDMDVSRVNHDIALLKLEPDESVTSASTDNEYSDILDTSLVIEQYAAYDSSSENSNISVSSPFFPACLEKQSVSSLSGVSNNGVGGYVGAFKVPSETERFSPEYLATLGSPIESGLPSQARCQLVGHSPSFSHRVQENGTDNTLFWKLRNFQSFVTSSDFSLPYIFCISRSSASERERCARRFIQNTSGEESATNMELTQLIRSGFKGIRTGAFLNDQGLALFCQRHDGRWFLNGLYNWINLKRNFISLRIGASYGTFSSRNYPHSYKGSGDCLWIMLARSSVDGSSLGNQITLQFMDFVMSYKDILFVFNGVGRNKKIHDIFSGHQSPFNLTIPSSQVTLVLRNNDDIAERRMNGSYRITTSAVLN
uniref:CUB domain-containing protein n=1 Tax=Ciona savignyi TaxID=51511 RepID=H2Y857_CIOSA